MIPRIQANVKSNTYAAARVEPNKVIEVRNMSHALATSPRVQPPPQ